jgi:Leucine-rich repeat (LRR) protein
MKINKDLAKGIIIGVGSMLVFTATMVEASPVSKTLNAFFNDIKIVVDGESLSNINRMGKSNEPFIVDGTTYLPIRAVSEALGQTVNWDQKTYTVHIGEEIQAEKIVIKDPNLETAIRDKLGKPTGALLSSDLNKITELTVQGLSIKSLDGIENLSNLTELNIGYNEISDISRLRELPNLSIVRLEFNKISDIRALRGLANLTIIMLGGNQVTDINALTGLPNLSYLGLNVNQINDIGPLGKLTNLELLDIRDNQISNIQSLNDLKKLKWLMLDDNKISDISPVSNFSNLITLSLTTNQVSDFNVLSKLSNLIDLKVEGNTLDSKSIELLKVLKTKGVSVDID